MTKKYTVPSLMILVKIVGILDRPKPLALRLAQMRIVNAERSVNSCFYFCCFPQPREDWQVRNCVFLEGMEIRFTVKE